MEIKKISDNVYETMPDKHKVFKLIFTIIIDEI